jgi:hypothetical protein
MPQMTNKHSDNFSFLSYIGISKLEIIINQNLDTGLLITNFVFMITEQKPFLERIPTFITVYFMELCVSYCLNCLQNIPVFDNTSLLSLVFCCQRKKQKHGY